MLRFLWFLLRALLVLFTLQALIGVGRSVSRSLGRGSQRGPGEGGERGPGGSGEGGGRGPGGSAGGGRGPGGSGRSRPRGEPMVDRSTVIDVPFTEEKREASRDTPPDAAAPDVHSGPR